MESGHGPKKLLSVAVVVSVCVGGGLCWSYPMRNGPVVKHKLHILDTRQETEERKDDLELDQTGSLLVLN